MTDMARETITYGAGGTSCYHFPANCLILTTRTLSICRFLLDVVDDIANTTYTAEALSTLGQVFSVSLPIKFRDMDLAEECIKAAIRLNPTCSKSNHRMGLFQFFKV